MKHLFTYLILYVCTSITSNVYPQDIKVEMLKQQNIDKMGVKTGNYSGIAHIKDNMYAVVSDKEKTDGFYIFNIDIDKNNGELISVSRNDSIFGNSKPQIYNNGICLRDCEGIAYRKSSNTFYISGEGDQRIIEYSYSGKPTGKELKIPEIFNIGNIQPNYGFEALTYNEKSKRFWTCTESALKKDISSKNSTQGTIVRLQSFGDNLLPEKQYAYKMEAPEKRKTSDEYAFGVPELTVMDDGRLIVMEREFHVTKSKLGSSVIIKLFIVDPSKSECINDSTNINLLDNKQILKKTPLVSFKTNLNLTSQNIANYEGMCLGPKLKDGRQTLILINDSQAGYGNSLYRLKDYIKILILDIPQG